MASLAAPVHYSRLWRSTEASIRDTNFIDTTYDSRFATIPKDADILIDRYCASVAAPPARLAAPRTRPSLAQQQREGAAAAGDGRRAEKAVSMDPLSDKATLMLIRRVLCSQKLSEKGRDAVPPIEELLPSLTSRNDVDLQLYAFLAIVIRESVQVWYNKITPDETFVAEVLQIIAHCSRALEQRFRTLDMESLILDEIPDLLDRHMTAYRISQNPISQEPVPVNPQEVYHALCPLPQLSPVPRAGDEQAVEEQMKNEAAYRQLLVQAVLAILLPTEDLENPCLTAIVGQIFSEMIVGNLVSGKASQPWLLYESICIVARILGEKKTRVTQRMVSGRQTAPVKAKGKKERIKWSAQAMFLTLIHFVVTIFSFVRLLITTLVASSSLPLRQAAVSFSSSSRDSGPSSNSHDDDGHDKPSKIPVLGFKVWQLLSHYIQQMFSVSHLPGVLRTLRGVLFPNNAPGQSTLAPPSSDDEFAALRKRAASALLDLLPTSVARVYLGRKTGLSTAQDSDTVDSMEGLLMVLNDEYCNKHLMYSVLELILVRLMPELNEKGVGELWEERLG
ncbi:hypothetical protein V2A60_005384 [Cordyceps javanica]|uniref:PXA domain-containing protein n=1 Tax=Cordyceps javanica TaxID=43265 RepID=A0A545W8T7_9HYPO|nr:PXA domain-containing protein [Cordyceps javanica]TQW10358.1 PXA domain protein [Cordyceps javanica]